MLLSSLIVVPSVSMKATDGAEVSVNPLNSELPSTAFYKKEKRSIYNTLESSSFIMPVNGMMSAGEGWKDPFLPGEDWETSFPGNVGDKGPIGDVSLPIIISIFLIYLVYRGVTTSRRRNNL